MGASVPNLPGAAAQGKSNQIPLSTNDPTKNHAIKNVFIIVMENHNWSDILNNPSATYINNNLLPQASYAQQYFNPPGLHPSEPNYLWMEAGSSFGIQSDGVPSNDSQSTQDHLVTELDKNSISWKVYAEGISGKDCPLSDNGLYATRHVPMLFFKDVTDNNNANSANCISHIRPFSELSSNLKSGSVARYNFIVPDLCHDMHDSDGCKTADSLKNGDQWLSKQVPMIMKSKAYKNGGAIFITWDESQKGDHPIGMIVLSPNAKGGGYSNDIHYTHSSLLRTIEEIFSIQPTLGDSAKSNDLSDLFTAFP